MILFCDEPISGLGKLELKLEIFFYDFMTLCFFMENQRFSFSLEYSETFERPCSKRQNNYMHDTSTVKSSIR